MLRRLLRKPLALNMDLAARIMRVLKDLRQIYDEQINFTGSAIADCIRHDGESLDLDAIRETLVGMAVAGLLKPEIVKNAGKTYVKFRIAKRLAAILWDDA